MHTAAHLVDALKEGYYGKFCVPALPPLPPAGEGWGEGRPEPVHDARHACIERSSRHLGPACIHAPNFALHFAGGRPASNRPDEGNTMSNGNGVTATLAKDRKSGVEGKSV